MSEQERKQNDLYVVVISTREERNQLKALCVKYNIPLTYPKLFEEEKLQFLWGVDKDGVGLVGMVVAMHKPKDHILHSINELETIICEGKLYV